MLVFTRKRNEGIVIGDGLEVVILRSGKDGVRLGIIAPPDVPVHRKEIYEQIREANRSAAQSAHSAPAAAGEPVGRTDGAS